MSPRRPAALLLLAGLMAPFPGCASAPEAAPPAPRADAPAPLPAAAPVSRTAAPRPWAHETSDIPVDPRIRFGHLDNGFRFAWASNPEPKERTYVRLHVDVGSLAEEESERGMAHFLEHMAFNGTRSFAPGTLVEWFQSQGMSFGADTNAHTSFSETVYKLDLPRNDEKTLREGLLVLRDFADGMLLEHEEVEAEKGVIDGEQRERDSAGFRVMERQLAIVFGGSRIAERLPIGKQEVRARFSADSVRRFYERWYRPEHMTLVVVGDLGDRDPVPLIREAFGDMAVPEAPLEREPGPGTVSSYGHFFTIRETEIPSVEISIARLRPWVEEPVTAANMVKDLPLAYARAMLNLRFRERAKEESAPFLSASATSNASLNVLDGENVDIRCAPEKWREALAAGEQELRRALEHGFQEAELAEVRADALRSLDEAVQREATAPSQALLNRILAAAENPGVPASAATRRSILRPAIEALTVEACHGAFRRAWSEGELTLAATGNLDLGEDGGATLRAAYEESRAVAVDAGREVATDAFAYASDPAVAGRVARRETVEDLGFERIRFENGVALNLKRTDFREKQVLVTVNFGEGNLTLEPADVLSLGMVGPVLVNGGGLAAHSADDLRRLTAGKQVGVGFGVGPDRFTLSGGTTAEDLLMEFEIACAHLRAPGWREDGLVQFRRQIPLMFEQMKSTPQGPAMREFIPALFSGDPRFGFPARESLESLGVDRVREWLLPIFADAPVEVSVVGDFDVEEALAHAARTFGTLPERREWRAHADRRAAPAPRPGVRQVHAIETRIPKSLVLIAFPTTDGIDTRRLRLLNMLNAVVSDRLRVEVREKLGAAYSPGSGSQASTVNPGVGMLMMQAMADPDTVETLVEACLAVADSLAKDGVTAEELDRLREPILNQRRDSKRTNAYWMGVLSRAQSDPDHLDAARAGDAFYREVKAEDVTPLARQYLPRERASILVVNPKREE